MKLAEEQLGKPVFKGDPIEILEPGIPIAKKILEEEGLPVAARMVRVIPGASRTNTRVRAERCRRVQRRTGQTLQGTLWRTATGTCSRIGMIFGREPARTCSRSQKTPLTASATCRRRTAYRMSVNTGTLDGTAVSRGRSMSFIPAGHGIHVCRFRISA